MADPVLAVDGLDAYYGSAPILQNVQFEMGAESVAVVGRNGMGKSTLCASIMGLMPSLRGSARASRRTGSPGSVSGTCRRGDGCSRRCPSTSTCG